MTFLTDAGIAPAHMYRLSRKKGFVVMSRSVFDRDEELDVVESDLDGNVWKKSGDYADFSLEPLPAGNAWGAEYETDTPLTMQNETRIRDRVIRTGHISAKNVGHMA